MFVSYSKMWIYILFTVLFLFAVYKERQALGCPEIPNGTDCNNVDGKAVQGTKVSFNLTSEEILRRIDYAAHFQERWVKWRASLIISIISTIIIIFIQYNRIATEQELALYSTVIAFAFTLYNNFYRFHLTDHVSKNISDGIAILQTRKLNRDIYP